MLLTENPLLTIVIATFNAEKSIELTIKSILEQTFRDFEVVIVDGLSTDSTLDVVRSFDSDKINIISERDKGIYDAWNKGVQLAKGKWLLFIGADDQLSHADCIRKFVDACEVSQLFDKYNVLYGNLIVRGRDGEQMDCIGGSWESPWGFRHRYLSASFPIPIMASFFNKETILSHGAFCLDYKIIADIELVIRISKTSPPVYLPDHVITIMGYGGVSTNPHRSLNLLIESFAVRRKHSLGTFSNLGFLFLAIKQLTKYCVAKYLGANVSGNLISTYQALKKYRFNTR